MSEIVILAVCFQLKQLKKHPIVRKMLEEEAEPFSQTDDDVGRAEELQVDINLTDSVPVQKRCNHFMLR